jgi:hypothetical protein
MAGVAERATLRLRAVTDNFDSEHDKMIDEALAQARAGVRLRQRTFDEVVTFLPSYRAVDGDSSSHRLSSVPHCPKERCR